MPDRRFLPQVQTVCARPCTCLEWRHDPATSVDGRHTTWQVLPTCPVHAHMLNPATHVWLTAEVAAAVAYAAHPLHTRTWREVLRERLGAGIDGVWPKARHRAEVPA